MIYADYNATTELCPKVQSFLLDRLKSGIFANPNSVHAQGQKVLMSMEKSRRVVAEVMGAKPEQVIFNSGSSEGISQLFHTLLDGKLAEGKKLIVTSCIEHSVMHQASQFYAQRGFEVLLLSATHDGVVELDSLQEVLSKRKNDIAFVSVMAANNETGVIQPFLEMSALCRENGVPFFSDTTQYIGKNPFHFQESGLDYAVCSGHKIGALIGSGFTLAKNAKNLLPYIFGGGQEGGKRGGTQNYIGIETLALALQSFQEEKHQFPALFKARIEFEAGLKAKCPEVVIIGEKAQRLGGTTLAAYPGLLGHSIQVELERRGIFVTTSSACSDKEPMGSKVLKGMKIQENIGKSVVRISFGLHGYEEGYSALLPALVETYQKLTRNSR